MKGTIRKQLPHGPVNTNFQIVLKLYGGVLPDLYIQLKFDVCAIKNLVVDEGDQPQNI